MCGIVGLSLAEPHPNACVVVTQMANRIRHRGPDSGGQFSAQHQRAHLGFRRLAIRDLDARANQPMVSASGKWAIAFNGEVYNSAELAQRYLSGHRLRTSSDTEVVLECIEREGWDVVSQFNGMFAMAVMNVQSGEVTLIRDRMGKKPLYVYQDGGLLAFGSELRSLKPFGLRVDPAYVGLYLHFGYFPSPYTFYQRTTQVCPGEMVHIRDSEVQSRQFYHRFVDQPWGTQTLGIEQLDQQIHDACRLRMLSDVPLGAFLSGGIDSALVAAHLTDPQRDPPPTFTIAFADQRHDEARDAADTAAQLGVPHQVIDIQQQDFASLAADFQDCYEQPYADTSGLVTMLLCEAVKQHVTVAIAGDGGDEFFGGYARYRWFQQALQAHRMPKMLRQLAGSTLAKIDPRRGQRLARWLQASDPAGLYTEVKRIFNATTPDQILDAGCQRVRPQDLVRNVFDQVSADPLAQAACFDATYYIPDDLQVKIDRASMRVALEVRCPLLDMRVAALGAGLRTKAKYAQGLKTMLKATLSKHVSAEVLSRPKHGFSVPLGSWLVGPMREWAEDSLRSNVVRECGWLDHDVASRVWQQLLNGKSEHATSAWVLLSLCQHLQQPKQEALFASLLQPNSGPVARAA